LLSIAFVFAALMGTQIQHLQTNANFNLKEYRKIQKKFKAISFSFSNAAQKFLQKNHCYSISGMSFLPSPTARSYAAKNKSSGSLDVIANSASLYGGNLDSLLFHPNWSCVTYFLLARDRFCYNLNLLFPPASS
jgi:hypothetical protein